MYAKFLNERITRFAADDEIVVFFDFLRRHGLIVPVIGLLRHIGRNF